VCPVHPRCISGGCLPTRFDLGAAELAAGWQAELLREEESGAGAAPEENGGSGGSRTTGSVRASAHRPETEVRVASPRLHPSDA
jgi:hypothetical protein